MSNLAEILHSAQTQAPAKNEPAPAPEPATPSPETTQAPAATAGTVDDDAGEEHEAPAEEKPKGPKDEKHVPLAALKSERQKRQQLERDLAEMKGRIEGLTQAKPAPDADATPVDPNEQFYSDGPAKFTERAISERLDQQKFELSEAIARRDHEDYDEVVAAFIDAAKGNPALFAQMKASALPAEFAYSTGKTYQEIAQYGGSLAEMKAKIESEARAKWDAEQAEKAAQETATRAPKTVATARGVGGHFTAQPDASLSAMLKRAQKKR